MVVANRGLRAKALWSARANVAFIFRLLNLRGHHTERSLKHKGKWIGSPRDMCVAVYEVLAARGVEDRPAFWEAFDIIMSAWRRSHAAALVTSEDCSTGQLPHKTRDCALGPCLVSRAVMGLFPESVRCIQERVYNQVIGSPDAWTNQPEYSYAIHIPKPVGSEELNKQRVLDVGSLTRKEPMSSVLGAIDRRLQADLLTGCNFAGQKGRPTHALLWSLLAVPLGPKTWVVWVALDVDGAFPNVRHEKLWAVLRAAGLGEEVVRFFKEAWGNHWVRGATPWGLLDPTPKKKGAKEGAKESPLFWLLYLEPVLWVMRAVFGVDVPTFVDDLNVVLMAESAVKLKVTLHLFMVRLASLMAAFDINLSLPKCKMYAPRGMPDMLVRVDAEAIRTAWCEHWPQLGPALAKEWGDRVDEWALVSARTIEFLKISPFLVSPDTPATKKILEACGWVLESVVRPPLMSSVAQSVIGGRIAYYACPCGMAEAPSRLVDVDIRRTAKRVMGVWMVRNTMVHALDGLGWEMPSVAATSAVPILQLWVREPENQGLRFANSR